MFTGLVAQEGSIRSAAAAGTGRTLWIRSTFDALVLGESIACDGVCLTVEETDAEPGAFRLHVGEETLRRTTLGARGPGDRLHLERALRMGDRLGGHWVQGHVDGVGVVRSVTPGAEWTRVVVAVPDGLERYLVAKGSVCLDGVSLTVNEAEGDTFAVGIIPHTSDLTHLTRLRAGDRVNIEVDILAKYVERLVGYKASPLTVDKLRAAGFTRD